MKFIYVVIIFLANQLLFAQDHIHWGSTGNPLRGLTITWRSQSSGDKIKWGYTQAYDQGEFTAERRDDYDGNLYDYTFPVLSASSTIHYKLFSDNVWKLEQRTFQTSIYPNSTHFSFIAGGDSRTNLADWQTSANKLATESPDFHLFLGDHVSSGKSTTQWDNWYANGVNYLENNLVYHSAGNHEYGPIYINQFVMPGIKKWYSFEFGNALFICLLSEADYSTQYDWLQEQLSSTTKTWKIVYFHRPFFTPGGHAGEMDAHRDTWWKAFDDFGVDVVINAHEHFYMRSKPINLNVSDSLSVAQYGDKQDQGRLEIIAGSFGAPLYSTASDWFVEKNISTMVYSKIEINENVLIMHARNMEGALIDSVILSK